MRMGKRKCGVSSTAAKRKNCWSLPVFDAQKDQDITVKPDRMVCPGFFFFNKGKKDSGSTAC